MASLFDTARRFRFPDLGVSELLGIKTAKDRPFANVPFGFRPTQTQQQLITQNPILSQPGLNYSPYIPTARRPSASVPAPGRAQVAGPVRTAQTAALPSVPSFDIERRVAEQKQQEGATTEAEKTSRAAAIGQEFEPIFGELDRQLGGISGMRGEWEAQVANLATGQAGLVESARERGIRQLEASKTEEESKARKSIRELEEDVRNQLQASRQLLGAFGAADSSATGLASEAVTRAGLKAKAPILEARNQALSEIELRNQDVNDLAGEQALKIDQWKSNKLFEISQFVGNAINGLNRAKATASQEKQRAINEQIFGLQNQFVDRLRQLDDAVTNYKSAVGTWQMQRQAGLEDFKTKLGLAAQFGGGAQTSATYRNAILDFQRLSNQVGPVMARNSIIDTYGYDPLGMGGVELTDQQIDEVVRQRNLFGINRPRPEEEALEALTAGQDQPAAQGGIRGLGQDVLGFLFGG